MSRAKLKKIAGASLALLMAFSPVTGHAADLNNSNTSTYTDGVEGYDVTGEDTTQGKVSSKTGVYDVNDTTYANTSEAKVYATRNSVFSVIIPKVITLDGSTRKGDYQVAVKGDLSGNQELSVVPEDSVVLKEQNAGVDAKADVTGSITQAKTVWNQSEMAVDEFTGTGVTVGVVSAGGITAGSWKGTFNFNINLTNGATVSLPAKGNTLSTYSWSEIQTISESGKASEYFSVGDTKDIDINGVTYTVAIADFDHDEMADGTGKAGITFSMVNGMNDERQMNATNTNVGGWEASEMRSYLSTDVYSGLSDDLKAAIKTVTKTTNAGGKTSIVTTTEDKLFLFSVDEVYGVSQSGSPQTGVGNGYTVYSSATSESEGTQYPYFQTPANVIKSVNGSISYWWLRSPSADSTYRFRSVNTDGYCGSYYANHSYGVVFGFSI